MASPYQNTHGGVFNQQNLTYSASTKKLIKGITANLFKLTYTTAFKEYYSRNM